MKKILLFLFILSCVQGFSQNPSNYYYRPVRESSIAQMIDSSFHVPRYNGTPVGLRVGSSQNSGALGIDTIGHGSFFYSGGKWRNQGSFSFTTRLIHGGVVTWDSLLVFSVSPAYYEINGAFYTSSQTQITLDAADPTFDRIDLIYLDSTGAHKVTGTASSNPAEPNLPVNSIRLTAISVAASATGPAGTVDTLVIYDQNVEWTGSTTSVTVDFDNTGNPYHFTKAASVDAITSSSIVKFTSTSTINALSYETLRFWIKLKAQFNPNTYLQIYWTNGGVRASTSVDLTNGTYGFVRTFTSTYMQINIPVSSFGFNTSVGSTVDGLYFQSTGTNGSGYYLDWIQLQTGIPQAQPPAQNQRFGLEDVLASTNRAFNQNGKTFDWYNATTWQLASNNVIRIFNNASSSGMFSPDGNNSVQATNTIAGLRIGASTNFVDAYADSTQAQKKISYNGNIHSTFGPFSHVDKLYADSVAGVAAAIPTLQQVTTAGNTSTNAILVKHNSGFDVVDNADQPAASITRVSSSGGGQLNLNNTSQFGNSFYVSEDQSVHNDIMTPNTGRASDTLATLADVRAGGGSTRSKGLFIGSPGSSESVGMWQTPVAITVSSLKAVLVGSSSPSVTYNIQFGTDRTSGTNVFTSGITCTSTTTGCSNSSGFNDATIPAGSFIWFVTTAQSGTVNQIEITLNYTED